MDHDSAQTPPRRPFRWAGLILPVLILLALVAGVVANPALRSLFADALGRIDPRAVAVTLPVQLVAILVCTAAQQALKVGIPFRSSFIARITRDAGHNLLIFPPGLGEAIGARVVVLLGGRGRSAVALRVLDVAAEVIGEIPYMVLAGTVLWGWWHRGGPVQTGPVQTGSVQGGGHVALWLLGAVIVVVLGWRLWRGSDHHLRWRASRMGRRVMAEIHLMKRELKRQRTGMPLAIVLHIIGWGLSGVQVWLAAKVMGVELPLFGALAIESAATSARVILFFVPGGLGMQEAGAVFAGLAVGIEPATALAFSLVLRLRDVCFGVALLWWPWLEYRRGSARRG
ncbi:MAG: flippase-like domain-containing protein [Sphingomonadales bacterium]|nr:flippase-like domain-containing protein [Sphingomonadales bacterium]MDE2171696.1 flippase-like domain-containing protein [Sphingomonadales bacterium]